MIAEVNPEIRKATDVLYTLSADPAVRAEYDMREKAWRDRVSQFHDAREEGIEKGIEKGRVEGRAEERVIWQGVVADKDAALAGKDAALAGKDAEIERLRAQLQAKAGG